MHLKMHVPFHMVFRISTPELQYTEHIEEQAAYEIGLIIQAPFRYFQALLDSLTGWQKTLFLVCVQVPLVIK